MILEPRYCFPFRLTVARNSYQLLPTVELERIMDAIEAIRDRRSIRKYRSDVVNDELLQVILQAGRWAPSASNKQPWHFIVIRSQETRERLADIHDYGRFMRESPVVIVVLGDPSKHPKYHLADSLKPHDCYAIGPAWKINNSILSEITKQNEINRIHIYNKSGIRVV